MSKLDKSMVEAAQDLGANRVAVVRKVIFPLSMPGVVSGVTMVFVPCVSTFIFLKSSAAARFPSLAILSRCNFKRRIIIIWAWRYRRADGAYPHLHGVHEPVRRSGFRGNGDLKKGALLFAMQSAA